MIKLVLLDIDDTICNSSKAYEYGLNKAYNFLKKRYPLLNKKVFLQTYTKARAQIYIELSGTASMHNRFLYFQRMFELLGLSLDPKVLDKITEVFWNNVYSHLRLSPRVKETLNTIKENNIKIGVISDLMAHVQIKKLEKLGISKYIDFIVTSEESGKEKPHPSIFLLALKKGNCLPEEAVMVGDSIERDIIGAKNVGITSVLVTKEKRKNPTPADYSITNIRELLDIIHIKGKRLSNNKIVILDLMGTVFTKGHIIKDVLLPITKRKNKDVKYKAIKEVYVKYSLGGITKDAFNKVVPRKAEEKMLNSIKLNPKAKAVMEYLKNKGVRIGVLSNLPKNWGEYLMSKFNLYSYVSTAVFSGEYHSRKPNDELYKIFMEKARVKPQNCYLVDDKLANIKEARFLSMKTIWLKREKQDIVFIPDYVITNISDMKKII